MQAVILAAGKSTRTYPLTLTRPKPLLNVANKAIIEHNLEQLEGLVDEVVIVVGYRAEMIKNFLGTKFGRIKISYVTQTSQIGNADALRAASKKVRGRFILMFGDDLYSRKDIERLLKSRNTILARKVKNPECFGVLETNGNIFCKVVEKPKKFISDLVSAGCFVFDRDIFNFLDKIALSERNEYELTDVYNLMSKKKEIKVVKVEDYWLPCTYPWSLLEANEFLLSRIKSKKGKGIKMERGVVLKGKVVIGEDTLIKSGTYIEGPVVIGRGCTIGPNCYIRGATALGDGCRIGQAVEVKNSIVGNNTNILHLSYVGDSVIGDNCNLGAGTITANLRHDRKNIRCIVKEELKDTGRQKLGVIMGDNCKTGIHTSFYPGVKMGSGCTTLPGEIVKRDLTAFLPELRAK